MKKLAFLIVFMAIGLYVHKIFVENPLDILEPVYLESRVTIDVPDTSRELEVVFFGEMASVEDCSKRREYYLTNLLEKCHACDIKSTECKTEIHSRNKRLFSDHQVHTTYLSLSKGNRFERNARLVVWGLNKKEALLMCETLRDQIAEKYQGTLTCI